MVNATQHYIEKAMASLCQSDDPNDQAACASLAVMLGAWRTGEAQLLLHRLRQVLNREKLLHHPEFSLN